VNVKIKFAKKHVMKEEDVFMGMRKSIWGKAIRAVLAAVVVAASVFNVGIENIWAEDTITDEKVAEIKARNEYYRSAFKEVESYSHADKTFSLQDFDGDGNEELLIGEGGIFVCEIFYYKDGTGGQVCSSFAAERYGSEYYYCADTGYLLNESGWNSNWPLNGVYTNVKFICLIGKGTQMAWTSIPLLSDSGYLNTGYQEHEYGYHWEGYDENQQYFAWNATTCDEEYVPQYANEIQAKLDTCAPEASRVRLTAELVYNDSNLDMFLPVEEDQIRERLLNPVDESEGILWKEKVPATFIKTVAQEDSLCSIGGGDDILDNLIFHAVKRSDASTESSVKEAISANNITSESMVIYEFTLSKADGTEVHELPEYCLIYFPLPENMSVDDDLQVYRLESDGGTLTECETGAWDGEVWFLTNHLSTYVLVDKSKTQPANKKDSNTTVGSATISESAETTSASDANAGLTESASMTVATNADSPKTGDASSCWIWITGIAGVGMLGVVYLTKRHRNHVN
jgi:hypothetical protein